MSWRRKGTEVINDVVWDWNLGQIPKVPLAAGELELPATFRVTVNHQICDTPEECGDFFLCT